ncbi:MAG: hypothetical protein KC544_06310 [Gemmatimonadetes bacterium]|nr:hypothetical protein [Gemmatimonadota bacterium]MCA9762731.1 hypothetical protein [Gemmatimonadota bacterium]HPF62287.1 hypothetical protein [Gemmatimonadales bacterium]HRX17587.1 hypothetical protein [Gemmatimonadales bacterium]
MIRANARSRLRDADLRLVLLVLSEGRAAERATLERRLAAEGPDALLDDPRLAARLLGVRTLLAPSPPLFVYVLVRRHLLDAGLLDIDLADYLAALVLDFGLRDRARRTAAGDDCATDYLVDLLQMIETSTGEERFRAIVHLGNYAMWLAGIFPDRIAARRIRRGGPDVGYYDLLGRRGYAEAGASPLADRVGLRPVYETAAERFPAIRATLNRLSDRVFFPEVQTADRGWRELARGG